MNYHPDDFLSLIEEAERQGGAHLREVCSPDSFRMNLPIDDENPTGPKHSVKMTSTGCRRAAKFLVPLLPDAYFSQVDVTNNAVYADYDDDGNRVVRPVDDSDFDFNPEHEHQALMGDGTPMLAKVCAVDDAMGLWPRFKDSMLTGESFQE